MKSIRISIIFFSLFLLSTALYAQNGNKELTQKIRGIVTDAASGMPLPFVTVTLQDKPETGTTSDDNGNFELKNVPVGRHTVKANFMGYETGIYREILVTSSKEVYLEISLNENTTQLDEVVIRPKVNKEFSLNNMATTGARMLSVEEASRYAGGMDDPARLVSSFAGVSPSVSTNGISIHGNAPHLLQWKLEDIEIPNPNHFADLSTLGGGTLSSLSAQVLGNSDFFTGAFPAEYNNAISGVFDMKLRNGNTQKHENTFQVGILGIDVASEGPLSRKNNSSYIVNYRYSTTGLLSKMMPSMDLGGTLDYQDLNFKLNFPTKSAGTFSVWGTGLVDKYIDDFDSDQSKWEFNSERKKSDAWMYMAAGGLTHKYYFANNAVLKTTVAATYHKQEGEEFSHDMELNRSPYLDLSTQTTNLSVNTSYNRKFSSRFTSKTGFNYTRTFYDMDLNLAPYEAQPLQNISKGDGATDLISAYNTSSLGISEQLTMNFGINSQLLTLSNSWTVEPRVGFRWQPSTKSTFALAYGLHSRMEKMDVYFVRNAATGEESVNKNLGFTKSHHVMLSYSYKINDDMLLKVEPYFQYLYNVPVVADSSFSVINRTDFYIEVPLTNAGRGRNIGVDITLEKYLSKGYYYMVTASVFDSKYKGGDGVWYNTKFNRNFIVNTLFGKEWMIGNNKQNMLSANVKFTLQGGDRYAPVDYEASMNHPDKEVQYEEKKAYSKQFSPMFLTNVTVSYKINRRKVSHEFAIKALNLTGYKEYFGHEYNLQSSTIEPNRRATSLSNISYKLEF